MRRPNIPSDPKDELYDFPEDDEDDLCWTCGGDGIETSDDLMAEDPLWFDGVDFITCRNCRGSGLRSDQTHW